MAPSHALAFVRASVKRWQGYVQAGLVSREINGVGVPTPSRKAEGLIAGSVIASCWWTPRGRWNPGMYGISMRENGEIAWLPGRLIAGRAARGTPRRHARDGRSWEFRRPRSTKKVNWVLDADIRDFFGSLDHGWLMKFLEHRVSDRRVLRLIQKWLRAGAIEDGAWSQTERGTAQGASASPLLANVYLHYVFDLWAHRWRRRHASGDMIIVRYADDYIIGFQHRRDAQRFLVDLRDRLAQFGLELAAQKTRLIEFGRFAAHNRRSRGQAKPETFDFLGFKHICSKTRNGRFLLKRITVGARMQAKLREIRIELRRRRHHPIPDQGRWLGSVVKGHMAYYAVPGNADAMIAFHDQVTRHWHKSLKRRSQRHNLPWTRMHRIAERWLPPVQRMHPFPNARFHANTQGRSPVR